MWSYKRAFTKLESYKTERLFLRRIERGDVDDMYEYSKDENITRWLLWSPHPSIKFTANYIENVIKGYKNGTFFEYAIVLRSNGKMIGSCGFADIDGQNLSGELGYVINDEYKNRGYAAEAAKAFIRIGFEELGLKRIYSRYMADNLASRRVMDKIGMKYEGMFRNSLYVKGVFRDIGVCSILREEFFINSDNIPNVEKVLDRNNVLRRFFL